MNTPMQQPQEPNFDPQTGKPIVKLPEVNQRDYVHLVLFLLFTLLTANCIYAGGLQAGFAVGALALLFCVLVYLRGILRFTPLAIFSLVSSCITIISFAIYQNTSFAVYKFAFLLLSLSIFFVSACGVKAPSLDDFRALLSPFYLFFGISCPTIPTAAKALGKKQASLGKQIGKILLGLCIAFPILCVLTALLIFSDQAFESFIDGLSFDFGELFSTLFFGLTLLLFGFPLVFAIRKKIVKLETANTKAYFSVLDGTLANTILAAVSLLYLTFLCTQLSYLIGGFAGLLPEDYTYAQYARRGFFEMCVICILNLGLLFLIELLVCRNGDGKLPWITRALSVFISGFSIFLVIVSIAKMFLYIRSYGLTFLRLGTSIFMFFLFFVFTAMILKTFCTNFKHMQAILAAACMILSLTAIIEPYQIIVGYNTYAYESGMHDTIDIYYLRHHCKDYGFPALIKLTENGNADIAEKAKTALNDYHNRFYYADTDIRGISLTSMRTHNALVEYYTK